jgi:hypothetical protein
LQSLPFTNSYSQVRADFIKLLMHNYGIMLPTLSCCQYCYQQAVSHRNYYS